MCVALVRSRSRPSVNDSHPPTSSHHLQPWRAPLNACNDKAQLCGAEIPEMYLAKENLPHGYTPSSPRGERVYTLASGNMPRLYAPCSAVQSGAVKTHTRWDGERNWLHAYSSTENSQGRFIRGTSRFCPIFSGNDGVAMDGQSITCTGTRMTSDSFYIYYLGYLKPLLERKKQYGNSHFIQLRKQLKEKAAFS